MYRSAEENVAANAVIKDETGWLTQKAMAEYEVFNKTRAITSNFDRKVKRLLEGGGKGSRNKRRWV